MHIETLIYAYLAVCTAMIAFNCVCIVYFRRRDAGQRRRATLVSARAAMQVRRLRSGEGISGDHAEFLRRRLGRVNNLMILDETLADLAGEFPEETRAYVAAVAPVLADLAGEGRYRDPMHRAYLAHVAAKYRLLSHDGTAPLARWLFGLLEEPSLYCRENALQALYAAGDRATAVRALRALDGNGYFHHRKLLVDGLLSFPGDRAGLARGLWDAFESFSTDMQAAVLDFIRFGDIEMDDEMFALLLDGDRDDELRFACIRYFGRRPDRRAYPLLLAFLKNRERERWEYAAIAASALASYPGERTVEALKRAMGSPSWYVRLNASKSLEAFHLTYRDLGDVMDGGDRYAREILQYRLDIESARRAAGPRGGEGEVTTA